ncbi:MAG: preprotein translocase subunit SecY [Candidatus Thermofonsia Clade 1 bacterium]|uniref:Protein translocase subunit SecY n=1 Tax=Candidatus Thermofonsia Clade 1 bacterium TaxID=2364210 RepID=A0A2M8PIX3_9CHLR|nr:MAG: preprotein translocase subunit SecY [Candidatus Thermofonsia Clade 1 bacterium]PJF42658.1 MAG: preprotein translocase subunit SecY [Candidatus Thermofonsia Clade 1 bacterium]RMF51649.1 MAG: preprotein translocase subunit SecY [Chloroflexota bacterium]
MLDAVRNAIRLPDLRNKILFTIFILVIYQFATHIPVPGVNREALRGLLDEGAGAGFIQVLNLLSGGAVTNFSILANGVYPFITAQIILQLLTGVIPRLEQIAKEPGGREKINQYTYYLAIPMALLQSVGQINIMQSFTQTPIIPNYGVNFLLTVQVLATMTAGTMFAIWLGNLITDEGIGNGISMIIFGGIVAQAPRNLGILLGDEEWWLFNIIAFILLTVITVIAIVIIQEGARRIPVQYGKRVRGQKQYGGGSTYIPLKVNAVGMIPLIFAQAVVTFPAVIGGIFFSNTPFGNWLRDTFGTRSGFWYWFFEFLLVVAFTYFYTDIMIQQQNLAENLQRQGGFIPGIRPGKRTQEYITRVTRRITFAGAMFLGIAAVTPGLMIIIDYLLTGRTDITRGSNPALVIGSAGLIIVVGVVVDTMRQLESQLVMRNYEGFMR